MIIILNKTLFLHKRLNDDSRETTHASQMEK